MKPSLDYDYYINIWKPRKHKIQTPHKCILCHDPMEACKSKLFCRLVHYDCRKEVSKLKAISKSVRG